MPQIEPLQEYVRHLKLILDKLDYQNGVRGLADSLRENIIITDGEIVILFRILGTEPAKWTEGQIEFIRQSNLDSAISTILEHMKDYSESFSPKEFVIYIKSLLSSYDEADKIT